MSKQPRTLLTTLGLSAALATAAVGATLTLPSPTTAAVTPVADVARPELADLIEDAQPSVVTISVEKSAPGRQALSFRGRPEMDDFFERFFGPEWRRQPGNEGMRPRMRGVGSGFIIDTDGYVVTNNHVVENAEVITVTTHDGKEHEAEILGSDPKTDLALLRIDADDLSAAEFGNSDDARVGDWVVAIGNPFGFGGTATVGIISARGRDLRAGPYDDFLQIDAPINQGNSGGPVFNLSLIHI